MAVYVSFTSTLGKDTDLSTLSFLNDKNEEVRVDFYEYEGWHDEDKLVYRLKNLFYVENGQELSADEITALKFVGVNLINENEGLYEDRVEADIEYVL